MTKYIINRPIAVTMIIVAIVVIGVVAIVGLPVSLMPNVDIPQITVKVEMSGASVQEVE